MEINKNITDVNRTIMNNRKIEYIVIHYVGAVSTAEANTKYFKSVNRKASAHYFVDDTSIWQCVEDKDAAWHCGGKLQGFRGHTYYKKCLNSNSLGIEMCCYKDINGKLDISSQTINRTIELVKELMQKYNISNDKVIRHFDVTGKNCPAPFVSDENRWNEFKKSLESGYKPSNPDKDNTRKIRTKAWQVVMNNVYRCGLEVDGSFGPKSQTQANKHYLHKTKFVKNRIRNDYVTWLQRRLKELGYNISVDGSFWSDTDKIVRQFQKDRGLKSDGSVGANTVRELLK